MFHDEFYPTPQELAERMAALVQMDAVQCVLEPSAGKGDLATAIARRLNSRENRYSRPKEQFFEGLDIDTVEVSPELRHILKGKGLRVVHDDFLTLETCKRYDLILMNPPFSEGARHLLKALEMQKIGGQIVCLLNAETLKNPCTNERRQLQAELTKRAAVVEFIPDAFTAGAERKARVEVALIYVNIPTVPPVSNIFENLRKAEANREGQAAEIGRPYGYLAENDLVKALVKQYGMEVKAGLQLIEEYSAMCPAILSRFRRKDEKYPCDKPVLWLTLGDTDSYNPKMATPNAFIRDIRAKYWEVLFNNEQFTGLLTTNLREEYQSKVEQMADYDFSLFNIYTIQEDMNRHLIRGVEDTILALFEELSNTYHWYNECSKNVHYFNGWKSNSAYKVNKKVIIPLQGFSSWSGRCDYSYTVLRKLGDIEKVFNYLDGGETDAIDLHACLKEAEAQGETKNIACKFFSVKFYKKGTCHITFTNERLLKKFNIFGANKRGWLPPTYGKVQYADMSAEEKAAVNEFEGESAYTETMRNTNYYLFSASNVLAIEAGTPDNMSA